MFRDIILKILENREHNTLLLVNAFKVIIAFHITKI